MYDLSKDENCKWQAKNLANEQRNDWHDYDIF